MDNGNSGDQSPQTHSNPLVGRDLDQVMAELEIREEAHRLEMEEMNRTIEELDAEIELLETAAQDLGRYREDYILSMGESSLDLEEGSLDGGDTPLSRAGTRFVDELPDISVNDLPDDCHSCDICMEPFDSSSSAEEPESPVKLPCGHVMGRSCISKWLTSSSNNSCPLCRRVLFDPEAPEPRLTEVLLDWLDVTHPPNETEWRELLQTTRPAVDAGVGEMRESAGLDSGDAESFEELYALTVQQATIERRLVAWESEDVPLTPLRVARLRELWEDDQRLRARLVAFLHRY